MNTNKAYTKWETEVTNCISQLLDIPTGDAQGIVEANEAKLRKMYAYSACAQEAADLICIAF